MWVENQNGGLYNLNFVRYIYIDCTGQDQYRFSIFFEDSTSVKRTLFSNLNEDTAKEILKKLKLHMIVNSNFVSKETLLEVE